jgi:hypothetical protein
MFIKKIALLAVSFLLVSPLALSQQANQVELEREALSIVKQFAGLLKPQLKAAMNAGGPVHAINICSTQAPEIAKLLSDQTGWKVNRVSLKARNHSSAVANQWETEKLNSFNLAQLQGKPVKKLIAAEEVDGEFRYMKAQGIEPVCMHCHGGNIKPEVNKALMKQYPNDKATGYSLGQVRGAFSLTKKL